MGGSLTDAAMTLMRWRGAVAESVAPHDYSTDVYSNTADAKTALNNVDWSGIPEYEGDIAKLREFYVMNIKNNPELVKWWVREHGAVGISINDATAYRPRIRRAGRCFLREPGASRFPECIRWS